MSDNNKYTFTKKEVEIIREWWWQMREHTYLLEEDIKLEKKISKMLGYEVDEDE